MEERRRNKRSDMKSTLIIKRLDNQDEHEVEIDITDVSKGGVGFICREALTVGAVYESYLTIWTKEVLHTFLQIVRIDMKGFEYAYGASFVGLPEMDAARIEVYQKFNE